MDRSSARLKGPMYDTPSDQRRNEPAPSAGSGSQPRGDQPTTAHRVMSSSGDPATVITGRSPLPAPALSDSSYRILDGRIMPGDRLAHFELIEFVGGGGMGRVFRAVDSQLGRTVALKVLMPEQAADPEALQRFQNEAQSSARLDHDNIARAFYIGEDRGLHFIAFEFVEGMNVRLLVEKQGPLPLAEAISYTLQVAEALVHADARAVVHRDIKPSNVLITPEGRVKLIDMGLARLRHADPAVADLTASGVTLGTFDYISPEQARDPRSADIRSDIYSLGCTLFFMLSGRPPFPEGTVLQKLLQHQGDQPPDICEMRPELPEEASRILRKMMAKDPRHRYATPSELVGELLFLADRIGLRPVSPNSRIWLVPQVSSISFLQRHLPWIAPVAALVCIVVLLDLFGASTAQRSDMASLPNERRETQSDKPSSKRSSKDNASRQALRRSTNEMVEGTDDPGVLAPSPPTDEGDGFKGDLGTGTSLGTFSQNPAKHYDELLLGPNTAPPLAGQGCVEVNGNAVLPKNPTEFDRISSASQEPSPLLPDTPKLIPSLNSIIPAKRTGVLTVTETPEGEEQFASLGAACAAARDGDVIELRFNGPREERPLKISNLKLTLRAGEGYEPVLVFRPDEVDPIRQPRGMISLAAGQLMVSGVVMELHVPRELPTDNWSMIETWGGQMVRFDRCAMTIYNASAQQTAYHQNVAFFRSRSAADGNATLGAERGVTPLATIEINDCIARGEADFLRIDDMQPVHLTWVNGFLATTERLLYVGSDQTTAKLDEESRIELRHVTAVVRGGICRMLSSASMPYQRNVSIASTDGIFMGTSGVPFVGSEGPASIASLQQRFTWNGDRNNYQNCDVFWTIRTAGAESGAENVNFAAWCDYWGPSRENQPSTAPILWKKKPELNRPMHALGPSDYLLEDPTFGDAISGAPGFRAERLPPLPSETAPLKNGFSMKNHAPNNAQPAAQTPSNEGPEPAKGAPLSLDQPGNSAAGKP